MATNEKPLTQDSSQATDNTDKSSFRLVAIRPYSESPKNTLKALHPDITYFLVGDYKDKYENGEWVDIEKSSEVGPLPHDFFSVNVLDENKQTLKMPFVNISAIVGKNGCGKSSLIEFLIRLINNIAIKQKFSSYQDSEYAEGAYGRVYYEIDKHIYYIDCSFSKEEDDKIKIHYSDTSDNISIIRKFFYSIISNYSLYAYNSNDNEKSWFANLFHKNDSYQMPIVITPMRDEGNIDINKENNLAKLRLLSIFSQAENSLGRKISDNKYAEGVKITLKDSSKLINYIRKNFRNDNTEDLFLKTRINDFKEYLNRIEKPEDNDGSFADDEFDKEIQFWTTFDQEFWTKHIDLIKHADSIAKDEFPYDTDHGQMYDYFDLLPTILKLRKPEYNKEIEKTFELLKEHCIFMNAFQFQRLMMIIYICYLWDKEDILGDINCAQAFSKLDKKHECKEARVQAHLYVVYKTITIFETYEPYKNIIFDFNIKGFILFDRKYQDNTGFFDSIKECFNLLFYEKGRIKVNYKSLKLRQTLNFLTIKDLAKEYDSASKKECKNDVHYNLSFDDIDRIIKGKKENGDEENMSLLPPPIFSTDIVVKENNHIFNLSNMSSGELQMIYSVGALIYHLRNLDYKVSNASFIEYKYISLVLEEVEQYFHPEYQQDYVLTLLKFIANACFKNIKGINILLVTHSPFVLSDIPKQNVLFLEEGKPNYSMQQNTFGANIHSMLKNGFFLNGLPIGEFAKEKINELTKKLHNGTYNIENKDNDKDILDMIKLIGEPVLKSQLLKMYSDYKLPYIYENKIKELEAKIAKLEKKI
ncbi:AAA family ATPase [Prevotella sp.]|uniref:AAA family ATPase n=1 Tax=Prevotella sp. TaxID=59823 RepID=UPI003DA47482